MRIGIDARLWSQTGVGRYVRNLVENLAEIDKGNEYALFVSGEDEEEIKQKIENYSSGDKSKFKIVRADIRWHSLSEQLRFPKIIEKESLDLMHFTYFSIPVFYRGAFVVTVHDLIVNNFSTGRASTLPYPVYFAKKLGYQTVMSSAIHRAQKIIVPSEAVRTNVIRTYRDLDASKIIVTYEGGFGEKTGIKNHESRIEGKYLLRVGNYYPHKNVEKLLAAFKNLILEEENEKLNLVLVGKKDYFYKRIIKEVDRLGIGGNVSFLENVGDEELYSLYKNAAATIIPSLAEGFSLTAVEAMSAGSLVIASDIPVHREVCGEAAVYFNPESAHEMTHKMNHALMLAPSSKRELIHAAEKQSQKFSWYQMAEETLSIYNSIK